MVTIKTIKIYEGDSDNLSVTIGDGTTDITNYIVYFTVKSDKDDPDTSATILKEITTHTKPLIGKTDIPILASDTKGKTSGDYVYDIRYDNGSGIISTILKGKFTIVQAVGDLDE